VLLVGKWFGVQTKQHVTRAAQDFFKMVLEKLIVKAAELDNTKIRTL